MSVRDQEWLKKELEYLLKKYFANVAVTNPIEIRFGREAKYRFGSIRLVVDKSSKSIRSIKGFKGLIRASNIPKKSIITITRMFAADEVPVEVVRYTIAHELCHYHHGFSSSNKRLFRFPHHGGVINRELTERGAEELIDPFKKWLKEYRKKILEGRAKID